MRYSRFARLFILALAVMTSRCQCAEDLISTIPDLPQVDVCVTPSPGAAELCYSALVAECTETPCKPALSVALADFGPSDTTVTEVVVKSVGDVPLKVFAPDKYPGTDTAGAYQVRDGEERDTLITTLEPGTSHTFTIEAQSGTCGGHLGSFAFFSNDADYPEGAVISGKREEPDDPIRVDFAGTMTGVPQIDLCVTATPGGGQTCYEAVKLANQAELCAGGGECLLPTLSVNLGDLDVDTGGTTEVVVKSIGEASLNIYAPQEDFAVDASNRFRVEGSYQPNDLVATLAPDSEHTFTITASGGICGIHHARFRFFSGDSRCLAGDPGDDFEPGQSDDPIIVDFTANLSGACMCPPSDTELNFGTVNLGDYKVKRFSYQSCGDFPLQVTSAAITNTGGGVFSPEPWLPGMEPPFELQPGEIAHVDVRYTPQFLSPTDSADAGILTVLSNNASGAQYTVYLVGRATEAPRCDLDAMPAVTDFGIVTTSATRQVRLINNGDIHCRLYDLARSSGASDFSLTGGEVPPDVSLAPGDSHFVEVEFAPTSNGDQMATFTAIGDDASAQISQVDFTVFGTDAVPDGTTCFLQVEPEFVDFGDVSVGDAILKTVTIRNLADDIGFPPCNVTSAHLTAGQPDFHGGDTGLLSSFFIPPNGELSAAIWFEPLSEGQKTGTLELRSPGGDHDVPLFGNALGAHLCVDVNGAVPATLECDQNQPCATAAFGPVVPPAVATRDITLTSCGEGILEIRGINLDPAGSDTFEMLEPSSEDLPVRLGPNASTNVKIRYTPVNTEGDFSGFDIISTATVEVARVTLTGNDDGTCHRILRCNPADLNFGTQNVGVTEIRTTICSNFGDDTLTVTNVTLTGDPDCALVSSTYAELAPGDSFPLQIACNPGQAGIRSATGAIISTACDVSPLAFSVEVNGLVPEYPLCIGSSTFSPVEKWRWTGTPDYPTYDDVWTTPAVVNLTDDNGDGLIDVLDTPDIVFTALKSTPPPVGNLNEEEYCKANDPQPAVMVAVSGDDGHELWTWGDLPVTGPDDPNARAFESEANVAVADIDADGKVEILCMKYSFFKPTTGCEPMDTSCCIEGKYAWGRLTALEHDGTFKWDSERFHLPDGFIENSSAPAIGDMNGDGLPEIALGNAVFNHNGILIFEGDTTTQSEPGHGEGGAGHGVFSAFADLDGDGTNELIAGRTAFDYDGSVLWDRADLHDGMVTVANLDSDPSPEIILFNGYNDYYILEHDGSTKYGPVHVTSGATDDDGNEEGFISTNPAVGDLDGDGSAEIVIAATALLYVYEHDTTEKWSVEVFDGTGMSGPTTFDFEGDGRAEVVYADEGSVYIFDGLNGSIKYQAERSSRTISDNPVVADVDNDGHAEIILSMESPTAIFGMYGLIVYGNADNNWIATRRIWNQHGYHITNISESGVVPAMEGRGWLQHNVYRSNVIYCE